MTSIEIVERIEMAARRIGRGYTGEYLEAYNEQFKAVFRTLNDIEIEIPLITSFLIKVEV